MRRAVAELARSHRAELDLDRERGRDDNPLRGVAEGAMTPAESRDASLGLDDGAGPRPAGEDSATDSGASLRSLLDAYERGVILAALGRVGGRQRSAAALLKILPSTLNEKMKRLRIRAQRAHLATIPPGDEICASLSWRGAVPPGGTLEVRGLNGPVRIEACAGEEVEVSAVRRGPRALFSAIEIKVVEHAHGVTVCAVCQGLDAGASRRAHSRIARAAASVSVELVARVPVGVHVVATTLNDDIEVVGLASNVDAGTSNGHVRFLHAPPTAALVVVS
jgi:hypothetical protein